MVIYNGWFGSVKNLDIEEVRKSINSGHNVNTLDKEGQNALFWLEASEAGKKEKGLEIAKLLIKNGINLEQTDNCQDTPLTDENIISQFPELTHLLIDCDANIHHENEWGENVLSYALYHGNPQLVDRLLELGMDINHKKKDGLTFAEDALSLIKQDRNRKLVLKELIRHEKKLNDVQRKIVEKERLRLLFVKRI